MCDFHGVKEKKIIEGEFDLIIEAIKRDGFAIKRGHYSEEYAAEVRGRLEEVYLMQCEESGGEENLKKIKDENIARALFLYSECFKNILFDEDLLAIVRTILDGAVTLYSQVGVISRPENRLYQVKWHRELQYQHFTSSRPLAIQTLVALDDFNPISGGTYFLPGSHMFEEFPSKEYVDSHEVQPLLGAGDVVFMNSMCYHRAGKNIGKMNRGLITTAYARPIISPQFNYKKLAKEHSLMLTPEEEEILGFRWDHTLTHIEWRKNRIKSAQSSTY